MPEPAITGPSNTGPDPVVTVGPVAAPLIRTGGQGITGGFIVEGLLLFDLVDFNVQQATWAGIALGFAVCAVQNLWEAKVGRRLIGAAR